MFLLAFVIGLWRCVLVMWLLLSALNFPPAAVLEAKTLAVAGGVYVLIQIAKQATVLQPYLKGWIAIAVNIAFSIAGALMVIPAGQVFTFQTAATILTVALTAAGAHGTINSFMPPTVLATSVASPGAPAKEVPAKVVPVSPDHVAV